MREALERFRAAHGEKALLYGGYTWPYFLSGQGERAVVLLPGAVGNAESTFMHVLELERDYRVLAVGYPPVPRMQELADGIAALVRHVGIEKATVIGGSYGAGVAQCFARRFPERISKLVLSHGGAPQPARAKRTERFVTLLPWLPLGLVRRVAALGASRLLPAASPDRDFWRSYVVESFSTLTKEDLLARYRAIVDFDANYKFSPDDDVPWRRSVLILESDNDPLVRAADRNALKGLYPEARVHTFHGTGHASAILRREEVFSVLREFLAKS